MAIKKVQVDGQQYELAGGNGGGSSLIVHHFVANSEEDIAQAFVGEDLHDVIENAANVVNHAFVVSLYTTNIVFHPCVFSSGEYDDDLSVLYLAQQENALMLLIGSDGIVEGVETY